MKRILFCLLVFFSFFFLIKTHAAAYTDCETRSFLGGSCGTFPLIGSYPENCNINGFAYCCKTAAACQGALATPTPTPTPSATPTPWQNPCNNNNKLPTAIGCIDYTSTTGLTKSLLTFAIGIGGGIAFLLMIIGSFMVMTSSGNPERQQAGKEMISSAIMGLLLILMSVFILQLIGVKILAIPGFG